MSQLRQTNWQERGVAVCLVTFDADPMARAYVEETGLQWPVLIDDQRALYHGYGMFRGSPRAIYGPLSVWRYVQLLWQGRRIKPSGKDYRQLGGDVLISPAGQVRFHFVSDNPHDRPDAQTILDYVPKPTGQPAQDS